MRECLAKDDFNGVLTIGPLPPRIEKDYVPGYWSLEPNIWFSPYWGRYYRHWYYVYNPGYFETYSLTRNEVDVYMTHSGSEMLIWSATSDQIDPATMEEVRMSVARQVAARLAKQGIIPGN